MPAGLLPDPSLHLPEDDELIARVGWLIRLRWVAAAGVAVATLAAAAWGIQVPVPELLGLALAIAAYNAGFVWVVRSGLRDARPLPWFKVLASAQFFVDWVALAIVVHLTGGLDSPLRAWFVFHAIIGSILISPRAIYLNALVGVLMIVALVVLEEAGVIHHVHLAIVEEDRQTPAGIVAVLGAFASAIFVSIYLATSITRELRRRTKDLASAFQQLEVLERAKSKFVFAVAHELKAPVAAVSSRLAILQEGLVGEVTERQQEVIARAARRLDGLQQLIRDLLALGSIESRLPERSEGEVDLRGVVRQVADLALPDAQLKGVTVDIVLGDSAATVAASEDDLERVVAQLLENAVKYTPKGGRVDVAVAPGRDGVRLVVRDTGIGIAEDAVPHIFEEFFRARNAKDFEEGTGLGLALVKKTVDCYRGQIRVDTRLGEGTTFTVTFPPAGEPPAAGQISAS